MTAHWDPDLYDRFRREREQPFADLLALIHRRPDMRVADLGCGPGRLTARLHRDLGACDTVGVDRDDAMLARAAEHAGGGVRFVREGIDAFARAHEGRGELDLIVSNAALHWIPDHEALIPRLARCLAPGGQLAFQIPANHDHPSHVLADEVAREPPFAAALAGYRRGVPVLDVARYAELLHRRGASSPLARVNVYLHELGGPDDVVSWVRGSLLTAFESRLSPDVFGAFVRRYRERLAEALPAARPLVYSYKRIFVTATV